MNFKEIIGNNEFSRQDYLRAFKNKSATTASRDLKVTVDKEIIRKQDDIPTAKYNYASNQELK